MKKQRGSRLVCRVKVDDGKRLHGPVLIAQRQQFEVAASPSVLPPYFLNPSSASVHNSGASRMRSGRHHPQGEVVAEI